MLIYFRHHTLRKGLWLIVLFASLLTQTQSLFACELMASGPQTTCCCDDNMGNGCQMGGGCEIPETGNITGCCDVSTDITVGLDNTTVGDPHYYKPLLTLDTVQSLVLLISSAELSTPASYVSSKFATHDFALSVPPPGTHTYLVTNRFRI